MAGLPMELIGAPVVIDGAKVVVAASNVAGPMVLGPDIAMAVAGSSVVAGP